MSKHIAPTFGLSAFHCPNCGVLSEQFWSSNLECHYKRILPGGQLVGEKFQPKNISLAICLHCQNYSVWLNQKMVFPLTGNVEIANPDLPPDVLQVYNEAKDIVNTSPRGAAALLRLALQQLMVHIGEEGKSLNDAIASLVRRGLPVQLQQALDIVRVVGNHAVHPGQIDLKDKPETALALFDFVNIICDYFITQPKKIAEVYGNLPDKDKQNIAKRDS
jgi:hypothetical protein